MATDQRSLNAQEREQQQLIRPPDLNQDDNRSATRLELFFDLALVLFVAQCADLLAAPSWSSAAAFTALLTLGWWSWASTALYANRFDTDDVVFRVLTLLGTVEAGAFRRGSCQACGYRSSTSPASSRPPTRAFQIRSGGGVEAASQQSGGAAGKCSP